MFSSHIAESKHQHSKTGKMNVWLPKTWALCILLFVWSSKCRSYLISSGSGMESSHDFRMLFLRKEAIRKKKGGRGKDLLMHRSTFCHLCPNPQNMVLWPRSPAEKLGFAQAKIISSTINPDGNKYIWSNNTQDNLCCKFKQKSHGLSEPIFICKNLNPDLVGWLLTRLASPVSALI